MAPYVDMASIVAATHKKKQTWIQWENLMLRTHAPHIYPNTDGNIGVKNVQIQVVCGMRLNNFSYTIYIYIYV